MAAATVPSGRSLLGKLAVSLGSRSGRPSRAAKAVAALAAGVREHAATFFAAGAFDFGAFHVPGGWGMCAGWVAVCASALVLDFTVRS